MIKVKVITNLTKNASLFSNTKKIINKNNKNIKKAVLSPDKNIKIPKIVIIMNNEFLNFSNLNKIKYNNKIGKCLIKKLP